MKRMVGLWGLMLAFALAAWVYAGGYRTVTTTATLTEADTAVLIDTSGGSFTLTLPDAATMGGRQIYLKKISGDEFTCTVAAADGQTIEGVASVPMRTPYEGGIGISNGAAWLVFANFVKATTTTTTTTSTTTTT